MRMSILPEVVAALLRHAAPGANVFSPLIRQLMLTHALTIGTGLGMTANDTHTRRVGHRRQIEDALRRWPGSLRLASEFVANERP